MAYDYSEILTQAQKWVDQAISEGHVQAETAKTLLTFDQRSPKQLFADNPDIATRPLIVAFMGGTGVGKSSLLNRLAGQSIAKVGVERPTSREVTLYQHRSLTMQSLPHALPIDSIKISQHDDDSKRQMVWIDMPDFDSVELSNKRLVLEWLPHIDVLLYVVSPERYRDNKAWQLLLAEGARHAWLFVMNQWDRGEMIQFDDFKRQLLAAGFSEPLMFRTSCSEPAHDDFPLLLAQLMELNGQHGVEQLSLHIDSQRRQALKQALQPLQTEISRRDFSRLKQSLDDLWQIKTEEFQQGLAWPMQQLAKYWAGTLGQQSDIKIWDDWAQNRLEDLFDEWILQAEADHIPAKPLKTALQNLRIQSGEKIVNQAEIHGRQALLKPGSGLRRFLILLTAVAETVLPLIAMAIVGYQVFSGYFHSAAEEAAYLGADFAIHSGLLIGLSWLIPFFIHKKIQPSLEKAAFKGLCKGLEQGLLNIAAEMAAVLDRQQQLQTEFSRQLHTWMEQCTSPTANPISKETILGRALMTE